MSPVGPPGRPWHCLNFLPDPQGHLSLRPTPAYSSSALLAVVLRTSASPSSSGADQTAPLGAPWQRLYFLPEPQ